MYIICEVGSNWHDLDDCMTSIEGASELGADAVKFQMFDSDDMYGEDTNLKPQEPDLYALHDVCIANDIDLMCTFFSPTKLLEHDHYVSAHKIASSDMEYKDLIAAALETGKPIYLSTGGHTLKEVEGILKFMDLPTDDDRLTLMYCESVYPAYCTDWRKVRLLREFGYPVGLSDHSMEITSTMQMADLIELSCIEKHVNLCGATGTPDEPHSLDEEQFQRFVRALFPIEEILSSEEYEMRSWHNRRETPRGFKRLRKGID